jgi:hypothetical protein
LQFKPNSWNLVNFLFYLNFDTSKRKFKNLKRKNYIYICQNSLGTEVELFVFVNFHILKSLVDTHFLWKWYLYFKGNFKYEYSRRQPSFYFGMEGQFMHCLIEVSKAPSLLANIKTICIGFAPNNNYKS